MRSRKKSRGFTLIEMMVSMAVLGILMVSMAQFYESFVRAARQSRAYSSIDENLTLVMDKMAKSLKSAARVSRVPGENPYEFVGIDGDVKFESAADTPHQDLQSTPNEHSDRVHFHGLDPMRLSDRGFREGGTERSYMSDRVYYAFWINGEESDSTMDELQNTWGIVMRKRYHTGTDTIPHYPSKDGDPSPVLDLNQSSTEFDGSHEYSNNVLGRNIDYLSFQYYDKKDGNWVNDWDTLGPEDGRFPTAVRVAIRGYDYRADRSGISTSRTVPPRWHMTTVILSGSK